MPRAPMMVLEDLGAPCSYDGARGLVISRVRPPSLNREVGTLSDSALEPSSRCPAPAMNQQFLARFEDLGSVSPPASSSLLTISRIRPSTFTVEVIRASDLYAVGTIGETTLRRPSRREGISTEVEPLPSALSPRAMFLTRGSHNRCWDSSSRLATLPSKGLTP